ncbi:MULTISPECIES: diguanylate cyclase [unclassified Paenibacillus]|uniref:histidine kinase N-terminal 7TM domain-containing diguanylate cyclase n=1 Tax=unclassified Paenibacillus TaxID=185978 RepID=UPI000CFBE4EA|nr:MULTISPECIES: diguanylate cyclase [unclassified Paenibacillus]PRA03864.1 GGDEF domain-containing protein [Paenibacillus sp. MYb63]PRA44683.1 GGDEF domain-containing protein [Paenibacillus sp. MYb67]
MNPLVWYDLFLFVLLFGVGVYVFATVRITNLHKVYFLFHGLMMLWPFCQFASTLTDDSGLQLFYVTLSFVAVSLLGSGWLLLTIFITGYAERLSAKGTFLLFVPAVIGAIGVVANPWNEFVIPLEGGYIERAYGPWFWVVMVILVSYFLVSLVVLFRAVYSSQTSAMIKKQVRITLWGILVLAVFATIDAILNVVLARWLPIIPGMTSLGIFLSDLFFVYVIKRYNVFDLVSIAHEDVINTIPYGILVLDENEVIVEANKASRSFMDLHVGDSFDMEAFLESVQVVGSCREFVNHYKKKENTLSHIEVIVERDSNIRHYILQSSPIVDSALVPIGHILTFQDVSQERFYVKEMNRQNVTLQERNQALDLIRQELSEANRKLEELALTDSLTNCYNRRYLTQHLNHEVITNIQYKTPFSLLLLDIDYFKAINDRYGHVIGDEVLVRTAEAVKQSIRSTDILTRYGGEEFMIYLPHTEHDLANQIAERVRTAVESNHIEVDHEIMQVSITISIGILSFEDFEMEHVPENPEGYLTQLFAAVDKALYQAKQNGRNRVEFAEFEREVI